MPTVGKSKFPYTSAGIREAQSFARKTGQKVDMAGSGGGYKKGGKAKVKKYARGGIKKKKMHHGGRVSGGMKDKQC